MLTGETYIIYLCNLCSYITYVTCITLCDMRMGLGRNLLLSDRMVPTDMLPHVLFLGIM